MIDFLINHFIYVLFYGRELYAKKDLCQQNFPTGWKIPFKLSGVDIFWILYSALLLLLYICENYRVEILYSYSISSVGFLVGPKKVGLNKKSVKILVTRQKYQ